MKVRSAFEERLIANSSESIFKNAKQLLKNSCIDGAFKDMHGVLHAVFTDKNAVKNHTHLELGSTIKAQCDCAEFNDRSADAPALCSHAVALWMYSGLFRLPEHDSNVDTDEANYLGLKNVGLESLAGECRKQAVAEVVINAESAFPHVPSKWENAVLSVRLRCGKKEYLGNLGNLRQLFFDKVLAVQLKFNDFSLLDRQIIRFLAINGEAENSNILLNSELTSEFFHSLGNFHNFFRNGRRVIIHNDCAAEAVVLAKTVKNNREYSPGIIYHNAALEIHSAKVITGKSGCWVGKNGEYFWLCSDCEVGMVRNFFRLGKWTNEHAFSGEFLKNMPFRLVRQENDTLAEKPVAMVLGGNLKGEELCLDLRFVYDNMAFMPDGGRLAVDRSGNFFLRQEMIEKELVNNLAMLKVSGRIADGNFTVGGLENIGLFLNEVLPDWLKRYKNLALTGSLAKLANGGNPLERIALECECMPDLSEKGNYVIRYKWQTANGGRAVWGNVADCARQHQKFIKTDNNRMAVIEGFDDITKLTKLVQNLNEDSSTFELSRMNLHYFRHLVRRWQGALPVELSDHSENMLNGSDEVVPGRQLELNVQLRSYQEQGVQWMRKMLMNDFNVILADEMGLGKTLQALALFNEMRKYSSQPSLVICPASLVENWQRECGKFLPGCKVGLLYGVERNQVAKAFNDYDLIITSYTMARRETAKLAKVQFDLLILDEAQHIKNPGTANAHSCKAIKALHKVVLTGTPLENSPEDLWSMFDFLHPGLLGSFSSFRKEYADIGDSEFLRHDLAARTAPFIKRRVKKDVAPELPPREDLAMFCTMDEEQQQLYEQVLAEGRASLQELSKSKSKSPKGNMQILTTLLRLRQICCHSRLMDENLTAPSAKFELLQELLLEHIDSGHKVLLFSQFTSMLKLVEEYLQSVNINYCYLDGSTRNRQEVVDKFNSSDDIPIFLLSLKAGGTGLNLTSADTVIIYDPWWNPATELQAADRTHRIGQTRAVRTIKLLVKDSVEEKILALQERKQEIFDQVVENPALSAEKFSIEDLKFLLG